MPNAIKYNTSSETLSLKKGNFWIGTGDVGKGPTSTTGFYNGITPPSGGYTIYINKESGGPTIYTVSTESQLTGLTNTIGITTNLVPNGGNFSDGTRNPFYYDYGSTPTVINIANNKPYVDSKSIYALQITNGGCWMSTADMMTVGKTYTFSFWAKKTDGTSGNIGYDKGPIWNNQNGSGELNSFSYPWGGVVLPTTTIDGNWRRYTYTFYYDAYRTQLYFYGVVGTTIFTEFQITEGSAAGGPGIPTSGQCLDWFASVPTDRMIFNMDYPAIITDGLIMNLDAGFAPSYPTIKTTLYDLSGKGNGGTLINGPTFSTNGGGSIHLDGVDDRIDIPKDMSGLTHNIQYDINWTVECWMYMYTPDTSPQTYKQIFGNYNGCNYDALPGNAAGFFIYDANSSSNVNCYFAFGPKNNPGGGQCPTISLGWNNSESSWVYGSAINKWCHFVMTSDDGTNYKLFINGAQQGATKTADFKNSQLRTDNNLTSTYNYSFGGQSIGYNEVDFGVMRMYNKPLSQSEILNNYNTQKTRFGL